LNRDMPREFMNSPVEIAVMWARVPVDSRHVVARLFDGVVDHFSKFGRIIETR